jgi:hypothetical protein
LGGTGKLLSFSEAISFENTNYVSGTIEGLEVMSHHATINLMYSSKDVLFKNCNIYSISNRFIFSTAIYIAGGKDTPDTNRISFVGCRLGNTTGGPAIISTIAGMTNYDVISLSGTLLDTVYATNKVVFNQITGPGKNFSRWIDGGGLLSYMSMILPNDYDDGIVHSPTIINNARGITLDAQSTIPDPGDWASMGTGDSFTLINRTNALLSAYFDSENFQIVYERYLKEGHSFSSSVLTITNFLALKTNYISANFVPTAGVTKFCPSNNAIYSVSTTKTNQIVAP